MYGNLNCYFVQHLRHALENPDLLHSDLGTLFVRCICSVSADVKMCEIVMCQPGSGLELKSSVRHVSETMAAQCKCILSGHSHTLSC